MELHLEKLVKDFAEVRALDTGDLTIQDGKLTGLLGPSGCGKSTLLYLISGLQSPTSGRIFFGDRDVTLLPPEKRGIGLVFQNYALYPHMTVEQNIAFPLVNQKVKKEEIRERTEEMAKLVQIGDLLKRKPSQLSGGQQQRVAIARALVKQPEILLLDEPSMGLSPLLVKEIFKIIRDINRQGVTVLLVEQNAKMALDIANRAYVLETGHIVKEGSADTLMHDDAVRKAYLG